MIVEILTIVCLLVLGLWINDVEDKLRRVNTAMVGLESDLCELNVANRLKCLEDNQQKMASVDVYLNQEIIKISKRKK